MLTVNPRPACTADLSNIRVTRNIRLWKRGPSRASLPAAQGGPEGRAQNCNYAERYFYYVEKIMFSIILECKDGEVG